MVSLICEYNSSIIVIIIVQQFELLFWFKYRNIQVEEEIKCLPWLYLQISWSYCHHFISMVLIPVYACKCQTFLKDCSCRIMPVVAKWVNFDFLVRLFFQKWIVLECDSNCFTLRILPFSKCSENSVIFESCFQSSALYLFIPMIIFLMLAQIFQWFLLSGF